MIVRMGEAGCVTIGGRGALADLANVRRTISIGRDWIVIICQDSAVLTGRSSDSQDGEPCRVTLYYRKEGQLLT